MAGSKITTTSGRETTMQKVACSSEMEKYFSLLQEELDRAYQLASKARSLGYDPETFVEIPQAEDVAARVEKLVGPPTVAERIRNLLKTNSREEVALIVATEVAREFKKHSVEKALDQAVRTGLAILTEGVLVAPLEGITKIEIMENPDGTNGPAIHFAGPIRSAGGTAQAMTLLIADAVRKELGIGRFVATKEEIERYKEEINLYAKEVSLQLKPTPEEIEALIKNCPICITGDGSGKSEVSGYRDLPRMGTNNVRTGACLVIAEGLYLKASKLKKYIRQFKLDGWDFLDSFSPYATKKEEKRIEIKPSDKYLKDIIAGRPVFSHPSRKGGFNLRYGRARNTGLAALVIHPATMELVDQFLALGTQMKIERPGKAGAVAACDSLSPPVVLLRNGDLLELNTIEEARKYKANIEKIVDLGDILLPFGEFMENNHPLMPGAYAVEWWEKELEKAVKERKEKMPRIHHKEIEAREAFAISERYDIPLHPKFNLLWHDLSVEEIEKLRDYIYNNGIYENEILTLPFHREIKEILVKLCALHRQRDGNLIFDKRYSYPLIRCLGLRKKFCPEEVVEQKGSEKE